MTGMVPPKRPPNPEVPSFGHFPKCSQCLVGLSKSLTSHIESPGIPFVDMNKKFPKLQNDRRVFNNLFLFVLLVFRLSFIPDSSDLNYQKLCSELTFWYWSEIDNICSLCAIFRTTRRPKHLKSVQRVPKTLRVPPDESGINLA